ncbi:unnamed protein product [Symbiodinium sp. CCMP2592]|nr:unnamed protein product [Symbiodinium sp. CCMP2592]
MNCSGYTFWPKRPCMNTNITAHSQNVVMLENCQLFASTMQPAADGTYSRRPAKRHSVACPSRHLQVDEGLNVPPSCELHRAVFGARERSRTKRSMGPTFPLFLGETKNDM